MADERVHGHDLGLSLGSIYAARKLRGGNNTGDVGEAGDGELESLPYPWATVRPAKHDTLESLLSRGIRTVVGEVQCKRCGVRRTIKYDLGTKFGELANYIAANRHAMDDRAPVEWINPVLPDCGECGRVNSMSPAIPAENSGINWLFLLLGQLLGCCTLGQLKYFCAMTKNHRTGAKNRVLYYTYLELCRQLCPKGPFDVRLPNDNGVATYDVLLLF